MDTTFRRKSLWIATACLLLTLIYFTGESPKKSENAFVIGTATGYAPFVSLNGAGAYEGFDIDVAQAISEKMDKVLEIKDLGSMPSLFLALEQGRVDALLWGISITKAREAQVTMIHYTGDTFTKMPILFLPWSEEGDPTLDQLLASRPGGLAVEAGSCEEEVLEEGYSHLQREPVATLTDGLLRVKYKKVAATAVDPAIIDFVIAQNPDLELLYIQIPDWLQIAGCGICVKKENRPLAQQIAAAIEELKENGELAQLEEKWLK